MKPDYREKYERAVFQESRWILDYPGTTEWCPPGAQPFGDDDVFGEWINKHLPIARRCSYCNERLRGVFIDITQADDAGIDPTEQTPDDDAGDRAGAKFTPNDLLDRLGQWVDPIYRLWTCSRCGFWQWCSVEFHRGSFDATIATPVVRTFERTLPEGCSHELAQQIARRAHRLCELGPKQLERLVAEVFRANHRHGEVRHVGRPGDGGIDVLLVDDGGREWLIQVKRRAGVNAVEGVDTVRNLLGTMIVEGRPRGIVVSTADHFSHFAHDSGVRAKAQSKGLVTEVKLLDRHLLLSLVGDLVPTDGWLRPLDDGRVCFAGNVEGLRARCLDVLGARVPTMRQLELFSARGRARGVRRSESGNRNTRR